MSVTATRTTEPSSADGTASQRTVRRVLIVGTRGGGGIHHYVDKQREQLDGAVDVAVHEMETPPHGSGVAWFLAGLLAAIRAALRFPFRTPPDVVHVHASHQFSFYRAAFYVLYARYVWNRPVVFHVHGSSFDEFLATESWAVSALQSFVLGASDRIVVLSEYWRDVLSTRVDEDRIEILPNAVEPDRFSPTFDADPQHVVFVSNLIERKGVRELVDAIDALADADVEFRATIAGSGPLSGDVEALVSAHENVEAPGYVSEDEKQSLLSEGSIFVLPAHAEGLPIAMLEGMAGGNAVISTTVGSIPEVITDERGILVEPGRTDELVDALETLVADPEGTADMARANREAIERRYSWDAVTERLLELYDEIADERRLSTR